MPVDAKTKRARFREMHASGFFCCRIHGISEACGGLSGTASRRLRRLAPGLLGVWGARMGICRGMRCWITCADLEATDLPVNADFEAGFADSAEGVGRNVALAVKTGVAGLSIEDRIGGELYELPLAIDRIRAAREAIDRSGEDVLLVGRSEGFLVGRTDLAATIERLVAYAEAGAHCLYAPGIKETVDIAAVVAAVAPKPVNALLLAGMRVADLASAGVRRVSVGGDWRLRRGLDSTVLFAN